VKNLYHMFHRLSEKEHVSQSQRQRVFFELKYSISLFIFVSSSRFLKKFLQRSKMKLGLLLSLSCSTQLRLSFSVELSWERSTQLNRVKSDSRLNSVNLMSWLELNCRFTFYQIFYQILYQSDQTLYHVLYHIFHHILYHVFYHILYYIFYHISHYILYHIFIIFLTMFLIIFFIIFSTTLSIIFPIIFSSYFSLYSLSYFSPISLSNFLSNWLQKKIWKKEKKYTIFST